MGTVQQSTSMMMIMMIQIELLTVQTDLDYDEKIIEMKFKGPQLKIKSVPTKSKL